MSKSPAKNETSGYPEYGVNSGIIRGFFDPPSLPSHRPGAALTAPIRFANTELIAIADFQHAELIGAQHSTNLAGLENDQLKTHDLQGLLDISEIMEMNLQATEG
ncbi:hypothetical protein HZ994_15265 [Akkermansiaceae bacterium]|nr:hypothetical protein HZ994_15265 [Akkermansiaceae bacterium]